MTRVDDRAWLMEAACADYPADWWFPEDSDPGIEHMALVRSICSTCPVRRPCLDYAVTTDRIGPRGGHGIWAGLTEGGRSSLRRTTCVGCRQEEDPAALWARVGNWRPTGLCGACDALRAHARAVRAEKERERYRLAHPVAPPPLPEVVAAEADWWDRQRVAVLNPR